MTAINSTPYREWTRYQWAGVQPIPVEPDAPHWNLTQWVGDLGPGPIARRTNPVDMPEGASGFSGFRHNPSATHWADGYRH